MPRLQERALAPFVLAAAISFAAIAQAPPEVVAKVADLSSEQNSQVMQHLDHLTNKIGPRLTGSERLTRACEWARDRFQSFGIANARLEEWGTVDVGFDRGVQKGHMKIGETTTPLVFGTNAWTPGTDGMKEGPAVLGPTDEAGLDELRAAAKGAWVVRPPKCLVTREIGDVCAEVGALGVVGNGGELIITSGNHTTKWDALPKLVRINLHKPVYEGLVARLGKGEAVTLGFDVQNHFKQGPIKLYNVLADVVGSEKPDEYVIVGGHIDSWDGATGTTDNGTGTATTLEAARLLMASGAKPKRTIRFMLWSGEEQGLLGSIAWIRNHPDELPKISAVLVHDGGTNYVSGIQSTAAMLPAMKIAFKPVVELLGQTLEEAVRARDPAESRRRPGESRPGDDGGSMRFTIREVAGLPRGIGSDHDAFLARGVPGFFWSQTGRANYTHTHHTQHDTYDAAIPEYQRHTSKVVALAALGIANLDEKLSRKEMTSEARSMVGRRRLGIQLVDDSLTIESVAEDSRAAKAGLKAGDKIVKIDATPVKDRGEMSDALNMGDFKKTITFVRDGKEMTAPVEFAAPDSRR